MKDKNDNVYHPKHYEIPGLPVESIVIIRAVLGEEGFKKFCRGNALKYLIRADNKGGVEDLKKARVYLGWEIGEGQAEDIDTIQAAKAIISHCDSQRGCASCEFFNSVRQSCRFSDSPNMWILPRRGDNDIDGDES